MLSNQNCECDCGTLELDFFMFIWAIMLFCLFELLCMFTLNEQHFWWGKTVSSIFAATVQLDVYLKSFVDIFSEWDIVLTFVNLHDHSDYCDLTSMP